MTDSTLPPTLPVAVLLVRDRSDRAKLAEALRGRAQPVFVDSAQDLELRVRRSVEPIIAVIAEPRDADGVPSAPALARLHALRPGLSLVGYCDAGHEYSSDILELAIAGVHELMFRRLDESRHVLASVLARATHATAAEHVLAIVLPQLPAAAATYVSYCVHHAREDFDVEQLASAFGLHRKTLGIRCREAGLPTPNALIAWCRLFVVAHMLAEGDRLVDDVALSLDFPSPGALRNLVKRYTGGRPLDLRAGGGVRAVVACFLRPDAFGRDAQPADEERPPARVAEEGHASPRVAGTIRRQPPRSAALGDR